MSTYEANYCSQSDVFNVLPEMSKYNQRSVLSTNWVASGTSNLYYLHSSGLIPSVLFKDGEDLGTEQGSQPSSDGQWRYVEADGRLEFFLSSSSASILNGSVFEGGIDFDTHLTNQIAKASDFIRSMAGMPIYPKKGVGYHNASQTDYPQIIVMSTAYMAASFLTAPYDQELSESLSDKVSNSEQTGWLNLIRKGEISISQQESLAKNKGIIREVSINGSSTSTIIDVKGKPTVEWDLIKISIDSGTGGTLTRGTNSTIKYTTKVGSSSGLQTSTAVDSDTVSGGWDYIGLGMWVMWSAGVLTDGDTYECEVSGLIDTATTKVKVALVERI